MPLRVELAANERVLIGNACIRNVGSLKIDFIVETRTKILRGKYLVEADEADTPCKRLLFAIGRMYLADDPRVHEDAVSGLADTIARAVPGSSAFLASIAEQVAAGDLYRALKHGRDLVDHEAALAPTAGARPLVLSPCPAT